MFLDSNCLNANKIINTRCDNLLTISSQTFHNTSHPICNCLIVRIEFNNTFAQLFAIQFDQISKSIRSLESWIHLAGFIFYNNLRFLLLDYVLCLNHYIICLLLHKNNVLHLTKCEFLKTELLNNKKLKFLSIIEKLLTMYCDPQWELLFFCAFSINIASSLLLSPVVLLL